MDAQWLGVTVAATVSLAAFIRSGLREIRGEVRETRDEVRALSREHREDFKALSGQLREDTQSLSQRQREDRANLEEAIARQTQQQREDHAKVTEKLTEVAERTARIEGILVSQGWAEFRASAAQAVPDEPPKKP